MKHLGLWLGASALVLNLGAGPVLADTTVNAVVLGTCGTMNYPVGQARATTQDQTGTLCTKGGGGGSGGAVFGPTADGSPAANPPVLIAGTIDGTGTGNVGVAKIDAAGNGYVLPGAITPTVPTTTLATGGTAQNIAATHGGYICNPLSTTDQGISPVEVIYVNIVTTATAVGNAGNSNITAGQCFNIPAGFSGNVSWIAATTGHKLNATVY